MRRVHSDLSYAPSCSMLHVCKVNKLTGPAGKATLPDDSVGDGFRFVSTKSFKLLVEDVAIRLLLRDCARNRVAIDAVESPRSHFFVLFIWKSLLAFGAWPAFIAVLGASLFPWLLTHSVFDNVVSATLVWGGACVFAVWYRWDGRVQLRIKAKKRKKHKTKLLKT